MTSIPIEAVKAELAKRLAWPKTFAEFLPYVRIEDAHKGDIPFEVWPHLVDRANSWDRGISEIILKSRQLGLSWEAAAYARYVARRFGAHVLVISMGQTYAYEFLSKVEYIDAHLPEHLKQTRDIDNDGEISWFEGGTVTALPSTPNAGRGFTGTLVILDEAAFHPHAKENYQAYRPTVADGGQLLIISTGNGRAGWYFETWNDANKKENDYKPVFIGWNARPGRDKAWYEREQRAFKGMPDLFKAENPSNPAEAFVGLTGLVYPMFKEEEHCIDGDPIPWEDCLYRYAGIDLGGGDPTAIAIWGVYKNKDSEFRFHKYAEWHKANGVPGLEEMAFYLLGWHDRAPFSDVEGDSIPAAEVINDSLRNVYGLPVRRTWSARWEGLGNVAQWLSNGWLTYNRGKCPETIWEFYTYRWLHRVDPNSKDRYATSTPHDHHGDQMDADRRALFGIYIDLINEPEEEPMPAYSGVDW